MAVVGAMARTGGEVDLVEVMDHSVHRVKDGAVGIILTAPDTRDRGTSGDWSGVCVECGSTWEALTRAGPSGGTWVHSRRAGRSTHYLGSMAH